MREAIQEAYRRKKFEITNKATYELDYPTLPEVGKIINEITVLGGPKARISEQLRMRCSDLFDLKVFKTGIIDIPFEKIMSGQTVLSLKNLPTETVKIAVSEFFLNKLFYELYAQGKSSELRGYIFLDEAHRVTYEGSPVDMFLRESRKYGWGVVLSSQRPSDFSDTTLANVGACLVLRCVLEKDAKFMSKHVMVDWIKIKNLNKPGEGYFHTGGEQPIMVNIKQMGERVTDKESAEFNQNIEKRRNEIIKEYIEVYEKAKYWKNISEGLEKKVKGLEKQYQDKIEELFLIKHNQKSKEKNIKMNEIGKEYAKKEKKMLSKARICNYGHTNEKNSKFCVMCGEKLRKD